MTAHPDPSDPQSDPAPRPLRDRARSVATWTVFQLVLSNAMRLGSNLVLTRLLAPDAFGLVAMAGVVASLMMLLSDIGIGRSIVREPDGDTPAFLHAAWRAKILRGSFIAGGVLIAAILLAVLGPHFAPPDSVYSDPMLPWLIAATAYTALVQGFESTCGELASRRMILNRIVPVQLGCQALNILVMIGVASVYPSPWALFAGTFVSASVNLILTHTVYPGPRMRWNSDPEMAARLWIFGRWIILSSSLTFLQMNADKLILAAVLGPTALGHYVIGLVWVEAGRMLFTTLSGRIAYPALSEAVLHRRSELPRLFARMQRLADAYLLAAFLALHFGADLLVRIVYTDLYTEVAHFLSLSAFGVLASRLQIGQELLLSLGDSRAVAAASAIRTGSIAIILPIGWFLAGVDGIVLASALYSLSQGPFMLWKLKRHLPDLDPTPEIVTQAAILVLAAGLLVI